MAALRFEEWRHEHSLPVGNELRGKIVAKHGTAKAMIEALGLGIANQRLTALLQGEGLPIYVQDWMRIMYADLLDRPELGIPE